MIDVTARDTNYQLRAMKRFSHWHDTVLKIHDLQVAWHDLAKDTTRLVGMDRTRQRRTYGTP